MASASCFFCWLLGKIIFCRIFKKVMGNILNTNKANKTNVVLALRRKFYFIFIFSMILGSFLFFGLAGHASATTYYVSSSGSDSNDGVSTSTPWAHHPWDGSATGNSASKVLTDGDQVLFKRGDSFSSVLISVDEGGTSDSIITGAYGDGDKPILDAGTNSYVILSNGKSNVTFQDLDLRNAVHTLGAVVFMGTMSNGILQRCSISGGSSGGLAVSGPGVTNSKILNNTIETEATDSIGIKIGSVSDIEVAGNTVKNISADKSSSYLMGIYLSQVDSSSIHDNIIGVDLDNRYTRGIWIENSDLNNIYSNTISNCWNGLEYPSSGGTGIYLLKSSENNNIYFNMLNANGGGINDETNSGNGGNRYYYNIISNSKVNSIDFRGSSEINYSEVFNNTIIHSPAGDAGHGIDTQISGKKLSIKNNLVTCDKSGTNIECITIAGPYTDVYVNYNLYYPTNGSKLGSTIGGQFDSLGGWQTNLAGIDAVLGKDLNSLESLPGFIDSENSNFQLEPTSPAIDAGTDVGLTTDYTGINHVYGTPDIGAYEYQPPFTFTLNDIPTTGSIRLYSDGKYRMITASSSAIVADFSVAPTNGVYYATTTQYMDITVNTWNTSGDYAKQWTATSTAGDYLTHATSTVYTIGDLKPNYPYTFLIDGSATTTAIIDNTQCTNSVCTADNDGKIQFIYMGGYSTHVFGLQDLAAPTISAVSASAGLASAIITWSTNEIASTKVDYGLTTSYGNSTAETDIATRVTSHSVTLTGLSQCTTYHYRVRSTDAASNETIDSDNTFKTTGCGGGGLPAGYTNTPQVPTASSGGAFKVIINNNKQITTSREVKLTFNAGSDTTRVALSEDPNFYLAPLQDFKPEMDFLLSPGDGLKTIYAKFYTQYGYAAAPVSTTITLNGASTLPASSTAWTPPTGYEYITGPSKIILYTQIIKDPTGKHLYGILKSSSKTQLPFNNDLYYGLKSNSAVKQLQEFLISKGYLAFGLNTGNYYRQTQNAVRAYQKANNITPANGRFGPKTRAKVNQEI